MMTALEEHSLFAESDRRQNCLACRHYYAHKGLVYCNLRAGVRKPLDEWNMADYERCVNRAQKCREFDDMRPKG